MDQATDTLAQLASGRAALSGAGLSGAGLADAGLADAGAGLPRVGIVRNPRSHRNRGCTEDGIAALADMLVESPRNRAQLTPALARLAAAGVGVLVIDGGDGTVRDVLTHGASVFGSCWPQLIILPKGKTNALAVDLGVPSKWSLAEALAAIGKGPGIRRRPLVIERVGPDDAAPVRASAEPPSDGPGEQECRAPAELCGFIFGAGAFNAAIATGQVAHRFGAFQGFAVGVTFAMGLAQALFGLGQGAWRKVSPMQLHGVVGEGQDAAGAGRQPLAHSGRGVAGARYLALFSTLRRFPAGLMPFRREDRGIRYLLIDSPLRRVVARLPLILRGADRDDDPHLGVHRGAGEEFLLDLAEDGFILDGEAFAPGRLRLRQGPALHFVTP